MAIAPRTLLLRLERVHQRYGGDAPRRKSELLRDLARRRLTSARDVLRLHECLCFLRAYPDDAATLRQVERMLGGFARRSDLGRFREELADSGIAGTPTHFAFYWSMARWLVRNWPERLSIDWEVFDRADRLRDRLDLLASPSETPALDEWDYAPREWLRRLAGPRETDAAFLVRRFAELPADEPWREKLFEELDTPLRLAPGPDTPSRTAAKYPGVEVCYQTDPLRGERPELRAELGRPPLRVRSLTPRVGQRVIDLARGAMVTRSRDLDVFANADRGDVRLIDCGDGLQFACIGMRPERRLLLEAVYGFLTLKNGVPVGYVLCSALFGSSEIAFNVFETFRGAEAGRTYGRVLASVHHLFGSDAFAIDPYQLGHHNAEGLRSGAWWFYYKFGFRPRDAGVRRVLRRELRRMRRDPGHRSSQATLEKLVVAYMFWYLDGEREDVLGRFSPGHVGLAVSRYLARRFGGLRQAGLRRCAAEAAERLGVRSRRRFTAGERVAWERWSPIVLLLPGLSRWSPAERRALVQVIRAKGGRRESDFVRRCNAHRKLRRALLRLAARGAQEAAS